jgi:O-antigen/teichoic acid export membrane protein
MNHDVSRLRTRNYINQIKGSFVFKGLAVAASFFAVPLMIRYLGQEQFGVWSTLLSMMSWIVFFDLGIGNGMRNKLAESLAKGETAEAASYISSGYSLIGLITLSLFALVAMATFLIPWQSIFNTQSVAEPILRYTVLVAVFFIFLNFWIGLINVVLGAVQKTSMVVFGQFTSNTLALTFVFTLTKIADASLLYLATAYGISLVAANVLLSFWFYRRRSELIPKPSFDNQHIRPILSLGLQFFVIQIAVLIIFTTDKILITQLFGPQYVTQYDVVFKLFSIISLVHTLVSVPLWSSYTDAYHRRDFAWIKRALHVQLMIFGIIVVVVIILIAMAKPIIVLWIGNDLVVSMPLVISMGAFVLVSTWNNIFAHFVNGVGKIKPQLFSAVIAMFLNIPLAILLTKYFGFGLNGVVLATCMSLILFAVIGPVQVYVMLGKDTEIC